MKPGLSRIGWSTEIKGEDSAKWLLIHCDSPLDASPALKALSFVLPCINLAESVLWESLEYCEWSEQSLFLSSIWAECSLDAPRSFLFCFLMPSFLRKWVFQWFFTWLSVLPGTLPAISDHLHKVIIIYVSAFTTFNFWLHFFLFPFFPFSLQKLCEIHKLFFNSVY